MVQSQQLEPRIYSNLPLKVNFLVLGNAYSSGGFVVDASLPVEDFKIKANQTILGYARSINIFGKSGQIQLLTPFVSASARAIVAGQDLMRNIVGFADPRIRISWNLLGSPSLSLQEYATYRQKTILGISFLAVVPWGQYDTDRILNLGANRWSIKPELGLTHTLTERINIELYTGIWLFTDNNEYLGDSKVSQNNLWTTQAHLIYSFGKSKPWIALNSTFFVGGKTSINNVGQNNFQSNYRGGFTFAYPIKTKHSLKLNLSFGVATRFGQSLKNIGIFYQYRWW